jgi:hypothetical protein
VLDRRRERGADQSGGTGQRRQLLVAMLDAMVLDHQRELPGRQVRARPTGHAQKRGAWGSLHLLELHQLKMGLGLGHGASHSMDVRSCCAI